MTDREYKQLVKAHHGKQAAKPMSNDTDLLTRIENHVAPLACHIAKRRGVQLLVEAAEEIKRLRGMIAKDEKAIVPAAETKPAEPVSSCCRVPMRVAGTSDEGTHWYECTYCGLACSPVPASHDSQGTE